MATTPELGVSNTAPNPALLAQDTTQTESVGIDGIGLEDIRNIEQRSYDIIERLRKTVFAPNNVKELQIRFNVSQAAEMVNRHAETIRDAEKSGRLPKPTLDAKGRRTGYSLEDVNHMRKVFGTLPWRAPDEEPVVIAVQNFKGGVAKSTTCCHLSQYLALQGYRVLVIDCDSQATTTTFFGFNPDMDLDTEDTLLPYLVHGGASSLHYATRATYWDGIDLVPANLGLYEAEYLLASKAGAGGNIFEKLHKGIDTVKGNYDVILLDPPPALGMISLSVLRAANAMIVPVPPATMDFSSTAHFFSMLVEALEALEKYGEPANYKFLKVLAAKVNDNKSAQTEMTKMMSSLYGDFMLDAHFKDSAEVDNATARLQTVYELDGPTTSAKTFKRCKAYLQAVNGEIEVLIRKTWPSHQQALRDQGLV